VESGATLRTDAAPEYGGGGRSFSPTDLLAAALGACIATSVDTVALRHGIPLDALLMTVSKRLEKDPKRVGALHVRLESSVPIAPDVIVRLRRAAAACTVHHSLHPDLDVQLEIVAGRHDRSSTPEA
jgi:putative redox protein